MIANEHHLAAQSSSKSDHMQAALESAPPSLVFPSVPGTCACNPVRRFLQSPTTLQSTFRSRLRFVSAWACVQLRPGIALSIEYRGYKLPNLNHLEPKEHSPHDKTGQFIFLALLRFARSFSRPAANSRRRDKPSTLESLGTTGTSEVLGSTSKDKEHHCFHIFRFFR